MTQLTTASHAVDTNLQKMAEFTRYNSGKNFLDSGDFYGRNYEKPVSKELIQLESDYPATINLTKWLTDNAEIHELHERFYESELLDNTERSWFELTPDFMGLEGYSQVARDNVYNSENDFDQVFIYEVYVPEYIECPDWLYCDDAVVVIYAHTGCDVRGGYSKPLFCTFPNSEFTLPIDWQCSYYSPQLSDGDNERLQVGYSGYPYGELEDMGLKFLRLEDTTMIYEREGEEVEVYAELHVC